MDSESSRVVSDKSTVKGLSMPRSFKLKSLCRDISKDSVVRGVPGDLAVFALKVVALEVTRRVSKSKCPLVWQSIQACQMLCYPPFKWVQSWAPLKGLVQGIRVLSRPLLVISLATALSEKSDRRSAADENNVARASEKLDEDSSSLQPFIDGDASNEDEASCSVSTENWLLNLYDELEKQGFSLPERLNEAELRRFYSAANGDFSCLLSSVKKTICWRETFNILSQDELQIWSNVVFWHGYDVRQRPCLIVRLGVACTGLPSHERPRIAQAIVSQMDHGILQLSDRNPQIMVLVDCEGLSPFRLPIQMIRSCSLLLQDHFPNCLGGLFVVRLPPVVRVMVQTLMKALNPVTRQKLNFLGEKYREVLSEYFQELPGFLGGTCVCATCSSGTSNNRWHFTPRVVLNNTHLIANGFNCGDIDLEYRRSEDDVHQSFDQLLRTAIIGILMLFVFVAFLAEIYSESQPHWFHQ